MPNSNSVPLPEFKYRSVGWWWRAYAWTDEVDCDKPIPKEGSVRLSLVFLLKCIDSPEYRCCCCIICCWHSFWLNCDLKVAFFLVLFVVFRFWLSDNVDATLAGFPTVFWPDLLFASRYTAEFCSAVATKSAVVPISYLRGLPLDRWRLLINSVSSTIQKLPKSSS